MTLRGRLSAALLSLGIAVVTAVGAAPAAPNAAWSELQPAHRQALAPLQRDWPALSEQQRAKWVEVASRFPQMKAEDRARLQARMADWAHMTPAERSRARLQFQEARNLPPTDRQAQWEAYQALPEAERRALAQRAKPTAAKASDAAPGLAPRPSPVAGAGKSNLVQSPSSARSRAVSPTAQQARPGATTTTMTTRATPPAHHQAGLPKIAATPGFVDPSTLLPQRGPQGAAVASLPSPNAPPASAAEP